MYLDNILPFAHFLLRKRIRNGDTVIDGTMGNGHDTLLLAKAVGKNGTVWAFDIQTQALVQTEKRLREAGESSQVCLVRASHEYLADYVKTPVSAAVFNFGWLPGGSKDCTTQARSSICALESVLECMEDNGLLVCVLYPGHESGMVEANTVEAWAEKLPQNGFSVLKYGFTNRQNRPPYLLAVEKLRQR